MIAHHAPCAKLLHRGFEAQKSANRSFFLNKIYPVLSNRVDSASDKVGRNSFGFSSSCGCSAFYLFFPVPWEATYFKVGFAHWYSVIPTTSFQRVIMFRYPAIGYA